MARASHRPVAGPAAIAAIALGLALGGAFGAAGRADAALWLQITTELASPRAGAATLVSVLTYYLTRNLCADDPRAAPIPNAIWSPPLHLEPAAFAPGSATPLPIPLTPRASPSAFWDGTVVFPAPGRWTLRVTSLQGSGADLACMGAVQALTVAPAAAPATGGGFGADLGRDAAALLAGLALAAGIVVVARGLARRAA